MTVSLPTRWASWNSAATKLHGKLSTLRIRSRPAGGALRGSSGWAQMKAKRPRIDTRISSPRIGPARAGPQAHRPALRGRAPRRFFLLALFLAFSGRLELPFRLASHLDERIDQLVDRLVFLGFATHPYESVQKLINGFFFFPHAPY